MIEPAPDTELYKVLNDMVRATGLTATTISELYLEGWVTKVEPYSEKDPEGRLIEGNRILFWKEFEHES